MYTSIKTQLTKCACPFNIISRINKYIRERERERERDVHFLYYLTLDIVIKCYLLKYRNLRKCPLLHNYFKSSVVYYFVATIYSFEFLVKMT